MKFREILRNIISTVTSHYVIVLLSMLSAVGIGAICRFWSFVKHFLLIKMPLYFSLILLCAIALIIFLVIIIKKHTANPRLDLFKVGDIISYKSEGDNAHRFTAYTIVGKTHSKLILDNGGKKTKEIPEALFTVDECKAENEKSFKSLSASIC